MSVDTETIDRLFLELSQFTTATTKREIQLRDLNAKLLASLKKIRRECVYSMDVPMPLVDAISEAAPLIAKAEELK